MRRFLLIPLLAAAFVAALASASSATIPAGYQLVTPWTVGTTSTAPVPTPFGGTATLTGGFGSKVTSTWNGTTGSPRSYPSSSQVSAYQHCLDGHTLGSGQDNTNTCLTVTSTLTFSTPVTNPVIRIQTGGGGYQGNGDCTTTTVSVGITGVNGAAPAGLTASSLTSTNSTWSNNTLAQIAARQNSARCSAENSDGAVDVLIPGTVTSVTFTYTVVAYTTQYDGGGIALPATGGVVLAVYVPPVSADLSIAKTATPQAPPGGPITWTMTVTNNGPDAAADWTVTDAIPAGVTNAATSTPGCTIASGTLTCTGGSLANGASQTITLTGNAPASSGTITNTATVSSSTSDPTPGNNTASASTVVDPVYGTPMVDGRVLAGLGLAGTVVGLGVLGGTRRRRAGLAR